ncbi:GTPase Era [Pseudoclavibacter caeni]|uniref:GTPase Era n=1 Tax=Pseudoclavibacter caeni TaxID=908846 RepID=A0A7C8BMS1_9MICO|nr:GTPase Era [Pseudoclavibacter caeni]KAB1631669.1 GTPase Era [Pseudoclavibacter caeni]NYJ97295.1 GTP-binding protein Era [Pseudoclavibacter caeni]
MSDRTQPERSTARPTKPADATPAPEVGHGEAPQPEEPVAHAGPVTDGSGSAGGTPFRAGFVAVVGRPNAGKSTLMNALVGEKIAITSSRPETTRRAIRGILTTASGQIVIVDTPGLHRPRTLLGQRLNDVVEAELDGVDVIAVCLPADEPTGPGDRRIVAQAFRHPRARHVALVTKTDRVARGRLPARLVEVDALADWDVIVPVSAVSGDQVDDVRDELIRQLPASPQLYESRTTTDDDLATRCAELVREAMLEDLHDELPHSLAVVVDEITPPEECAERPIARVYASVYVERDSQKGIVIGRGGQSLRRYGTAARREIERLVGGRVHLDLRVKVAREWQSSPKLLDRLGF